MSGTDDFTDCPSCRSNTIGVPVQVVDGMPITYCPACGFIVSELVGADLEVEGFRGTLDGAGADEVTFDLPNVLPALNEGAFWELRAGYAAHFTPGSFARFVRSSGFEVAELRIDENDDRRFHLKALRANGPTVPRYELEDDLAAITDAVAALPSAAERQVFKWRRVIGEFQAEETPVTVFGLPQSIDAFVTALELDDRRISRAIDTATASSVVIALGPSHRAEAMEYLRRLDPRPLVLTP